MANYRSKLNARLKEILDNYLDIQANGMKQGKWVDESLRENRPIPVTVEFEGDLQILVEAGLQNAVLYDETHADGGLYPGLIVSFAELDLVKHISAAAPQFVDLDLSIPDIAANQVWSVNKGLAKFSGDTGKGVVIGVIDSGIDFAHKFFLSGISKPYKTRIARIWDMGLSPQAGESGPRHPSWLGLPPLTPAFAGSVYGVEYESDAIEAQLNGIVPFVPVRHRDCSGHGTHVAATAAGNGLTLFDYVGVAPEAEIVMVKFLHLETPPESQIPPVSVDGDRRFEHAINYILNYAKSGDPLKPNKPVVINYSVGSTSGPHDGREDNELYIDKIFGTSSSRAFVKSAGNGAGANKHMELSIPAGGSQIIQFSITDKRKDKNDYDSCKAVSNTYAQGIEIWYPKSASTSISAEVTLPGNIKLKDKGLDLGSSSANFGPRNNFKATIEHSSEIKNGRALNSISMLFLPFNESFQTENDNAVVYQCELKSTKNVTLLLWARGSRRLGTSFKNAGAFGDKMTLSIPAHAKSAITVASYKTKEPGGVTFSAGVGNISSFSSRGPIATYGAPAAFQKPDVAAPGEQISSAMSRHTMPMKKFVFDPSVATTEMQGTSMSTPHVTGIVALMLQKNPTLTTADVKIKLKAGATRPHLSSPDEYGDGRVNAKKAHDNA
jgi:subtilisin family serine protease